MTSPNELILKLRAAVAVLPRGLQAHVLTVEVEAVRLAGLHGLDPDRLRIAALGHDLARGELPERLPALAARYGAEIDAVERASPILLHGPVAARMLIHDYACDDAEILDAIAVHTTASPGMTALAKALFVADKVDPTKVARKPRLAEVRELADTNLDSAVLRYLDLNLLEAVERGWQVHPRTLAARNELLGAVKGP